MEFNSGFKGLNIDVEDKTEDVGYKPALAPIYPPLIPQEHPWGKNPVLRSEKPVTKHPSAWRILQIGQRRFFSMSVGLPFVWLDKFWRYKERLYILRVEIGYFLMGSRITEFEDKFDT